MDKAAAMSIGLLLAAGVVVLAISRITHLAPVVIFFAFVVLAMFAGFLRRH